MSIDAKQLDHLAKLTGLTLEPDLQAHLSQDLDQIIHFMHELTQVDTTGVLPLCHPNDEQRQPMRADAVITQNWQKDMAKQAPDFSQGHYLVPKVIGSES